MKKVIVCLVVLFVMSSVADALVKIDVDFATQVTASTFKRSYLPPYPVPTQSGSRRGPESLFDGSGMTGDQLGDLVLGYAGNEVDHMMFTTPDQVHNGALGLGVMTVQWLEIDVSQSGPIGQMGIWPGNEFHYGCVMDVRDFTVLTSVGGVYSIEGQHQLAQGQGGAIGTAQTDLPVGAVIDFGGAEVDTILIAVAPGWDLMGGTPGDAERNWAYGGTYYGESCFGEIILYEVPEPATMLLLGLGGLVLRRRK